MRWMKILLVVLVAAVAMAGPASAQQDYIGCVDLVKSAKDTVRAFGFTGRPGDTVLLPILMKNDSICVGFQILVRFDSAKLTPIFIRDSVCDSVDAFDQCVRYAVDSSFVDHIVAGRLVELDSVPDGFGGWVYDTVTNFNINLFEQRRNVLALNFLPTLQKLDSIAKGSGVITYVKFRIKPTVPHNAIGNFTFYEADICVDTGIPPVTTCYDGCNETQMVLAEIIAPDTATQTIQVFPRTVGASFRADTTSVPDPTLTFQANPTSLGSSGGTVGLLWTATNADSVVITAPLSPAYHFVSTLLTGSTTSPNITSNTTFTAKAFKGSAKSITQTAAVTVGTIQNCPVVVTFAPSNSTYTINQGETVAFQVTGTGNSGQTISLTANSLPNNATFSPSNPVIGTTSATGNFSFTPDFNQKGSFQVSFSASNGTCSSSGSALIIVNELQKDRLFSTSAAKQKPVGGLRGTGGIKFPINLISAKTVYGVNFDMDFPYNYVSVDSFVVTNRIPDYAVYDNLGETPGTVRVYTFGLQNDSVKTDVSTAILFAYMTLDSNAVPWTDYPINMRNGRESVNPDPNFPSLELQTDSGIIQCDKPGDVNLDKFIDVADMVNIVSSIIQTFTLNNRQFRAADIIVNDSVNVFDLVADINLGYGRPVNPAPPAPAAPATIALSYGDIPMGGSDLMVVRSELPQEVAAVQMDIGYDPNAVAMGTPRLTTDNDNYIIQYKDNNAGKLRVLIYTPNLSASAVLMKAGSANLVSVPVTAKTNITSGDKNKIRLTQALMSTTGAASITVKGTDAPLPTGFLLAQNYPNPFNPTTTIEYSIGSFDDGSANKRVQLEIYNMLGQLVRTLVDADRKPGNYKEDWDATNSVGQRVSSGVYLYRLRVGSENQTKKMLLLK